jgi:hypothetical protein
MIIYLDRSCEEHGLPVLRRLRSVTRLEKHPSGPTRAQLDTVEMISAFAIAKTPLAFSPIDSRALPRGFGSRLLAPGEPPTNPSGLKNVLVMFYCGCTPDEVAMDREIAHLQRNISRIRREIRLQGAEMQALIDADLDCTDAARLLMRMQADLVLFIEKRERLKAPETA